MTSTTIPTRVTIREVGPRDGLQSIARVMPTAAKKRWIKAAKSPGRQEPADLAYAQLAGIKAGLPAAAEPAHPYARALLEKAAGRNKEAEADFQKALSLAGGDIILRYLCQMALLEN